LDVLWYLPLRRLGRVDVGVYELVVAKGFCKPSKLQHRTPAFDRGDFQAATTQP
jgi:hypothetical protein